MDNPWNVKSTSDNIQSDLNRFTPKENPKGRSANVMDVRVELPDKETRPRI